MISTLPRVRPLLRAAAVAPRERSEVAARRVQDLLFCAALLVCAIGHWVVLAREPVPSGLDPGNWLAFGHAILGEHLRSSSIVYPPLVPVLAVTVVGVFGVVTGVHLVATLATAAPAVGTYVLLRRAGAGWVAPALAGVVAAAASTGEAAAWGGYPQLLSLGFMCLLVVWWDSFLRSGAVRPAVGSALALVGALASNELIGIACLLLVPVLLLLHVSVRPREVAAQWRRLAVGAITIGLPSLPLVPTYVRLVTAARQQAREYPTPSPHLSEVITWTNTLYREFPLFWQIALLLAVAAPFALYQHRRHPLWMATTAMLVVSSALIVLTRESRYTYLLPTLAVCGVALWASAARVPFVSTRATEWARSVAALALIGTLGLQIVAGLGFFTKQVAYYTVLQPGIVTGLDWLRANTAPDTTVAVTPTPAGYPLGWWVEGYAQRPTVYMSPVSYLLFDDERNRAAIAASIFNSQPKLGGVCSRALQHGIDYLFIDKGWADSQGFSTGLTLPGGSRVIVDNEALLLVRCSS